MLVFKRTNKGFSLIEVMTALVLGLVVMLMVVQLFINAKNNHTQNERVSETLESGRYALRQLSTDLKEAGFFGGVIDTSLVTMDGALASPTNDCGASGVVNWAYDVNTYRAVQYDDQTSSNTNHVCVNTTYLVGNTDILSIKRVYNNPYQTTAAASPLTKNNIYLRSDFSTACLWYYDGSSANPAGANCPSASSNTFDWLYLANVYYIRNYYQTVGDGIPTLCRESLGGSAAGPGMSEVCLAPGVQAFHVMFGLDTDTPRDGVANQYIANPTATQLRNQVVSARIYVLVRAQKQDSKLVDTKTYYMGDLKLGPFKDKYYRRMYSTTVLLRNPMYSATFNAY